MYNKILEVFVNISLIKTLKCIIKIVINCVKPYQLLFWHKKHIKIYKKLKNFCKIYLIFVINLL